jgi:hypothetical protein
LQYLDPEPESILANRAGRFLNLMILGPGAAYIGGRHGEWKLEEMRGIAPLAQAFRLNEIPEGTPATGAGKLLLGDFAHFAEFLGALTSPA